MKRLDWSHEHWMRTRSACCVYGGCILYDDPGRQLATSPTSDGYDSCDPLLSLYQCSYEKRADTCTHNKSRKAGPFSVARLKLDLPFHSLANNRVHRRSASPLDLSARCPPSPPERCCFRTHKARLSLGCCCLSTRCCAAAAPSGVDPQEISNIDFQY